MRAFGFVVTLLSVVEEEGEKRDYKRTGGFPHHPPHGPSTQPFKSHATESMPITLSDPFDLSFHFQTHSTDISLCLALHKHRLLRVHNRLVSSLKELASNFFSF